MAERSVRGSVVKALAAEATRRKREKADRATETPAREEEGPRRSRPRSGMPRRAGPDPRRAAPAAAAASQPSLPLKGKLLVIHANTKTYGRGGDTAAAGDDHRLVAAKRSNREDFKFAAKDYIAMRDGGVYSGDPRENKLLPLPRPTYTEFIERAQRAKALDRLFFVFCPPDAPRLPRVDYRAYERVVYAGVSIRRFAKIWQPERHHFFKPQFQARVMAMLLARNARAALWVRVRSAPGRAPARHPRLRVEQEGRAPRRLRRPRDREFGPAPPVPAGARVERHPRPSLRRGLSRRRRLLGPAA